MGNLGIVLLSLQADELHLSSYSGTRKVFLNKGLGIFSGDALIELDFYLRET